ncbi:MAG TPA: hypothetical protein VMR52_09130 [Dehalococcoidia bacterium]|nr:hypothetical protein [Dehalococcoidia bacterium]
MSSSFTWWFINLGITLIWLAVGIKSENWFLAAGSLVYFAIAMLVDLPGTSAEEGTWDEDGEDESILS